MKKEKAYFSGKNILVVQDQEGVKDPEELEDLQISDRIILKSSGYTCDEMAVNENYILTQLRTLPHFNRSNLPDPMILGAGKEALLPYRYRTVLSVYLKPNCVGIASAQKELSEFINFSCKEYDLVGHSKGGLLFSGLELERPTRIVFIAPTMGTIMGDESLVFKKLTEYQAQNHCTIPKKSFIALYKWIIHLIGSRRPVDLDMAPNSEFLTNLNLSGLSKHKVLLITATCPQDNCNFQDTFFRYAGSFLGLDQEGDGMVSLEAQMRIAPYAEKVLNVKSTHPSVINNPWTIRAIREFLQ